MKLTLNKNQVSSKITAELKIENDEEFTAVFVKASKVGEPYGMPFGINLVKTDGDKVIYMDSPVKEFTFLFDGSGFSEDGEWRVSAFVKNQAGIWNDTCTLFDNTGKTFVDSNGDVLCCKRDLSGADELFLSSFSGEEIDTFITEVLS